MPANASERSALKPAGPVTWTVTPSGVPDRRWWRMWETTVCVSALDFTAANACAARPSLEVVAGDVPVVWSTLDSDFATV